MTEPRVVVMEPVPRVRRARESRPDAVASTIPGLSNRAAGRLRAEAAAPAPLAFGGFGYERTAQDEADVERARRPPPPRVAPPDPDQAPPDQVLPPGTAPGPLAFGGFAYERTQQDEAEVAAASRARDRAAGGEGPQGPGEPASPTSTTVVPLMSEGIEPGTEPGPGPVGEPGGMPGEVRRAATAPARTPSAGAPAGAPAPESVTTPEELVAAVRTSAEALPHGLPTRPPLSAVLEPRVTAAQARAARQRHVGGGGRIPRPRPPQPIDVDPIPVATEAIRTALAAKLPDLTLPRLQRMPDGTLPRLAAPTSAAPQELRTQVVLTQPGTPSISVNNTEAARYFTAASLACTSPVIADPAAIPQTELVLLDFRRPEPPPLPEAQTQLESAQVTQVLASVLASVHRRAEVIVQGVRDEAFPRMANHKEKLTEPLVGTVETELRDKMSELQRAAGIAPAALEAAVQARQLELNAHLQHVATEDELTLRRTTEAVSAQAQREAARLEVARRREEARRVQRLRLALHSRNPALVEDLVNTRLGFIRSDVARGVVAIEAAGTRRKVLIEEYRLAYLDAYRRADNAFQHRVPGVQGQPATVSGRIWFDVVADELVAQMRSRTDQTTADVATLGGQLQDAGRRATAAVREWADGRLRRTLTDEDRQRRAAEDANAQEAATAEARTRAEQEAVRNRLLGEIRFASAAYLQAQDDARQVCVDRAIHLDDAQMEIGRRYLSGGDAHDPLSAVAAVLVGRYREEHQHLRVADLQHQIYEITAADEDEASELAEIYFPKGDVDLRSRVLKLWRAFEGPGTDESDVISALEGVEGPPMRLLNRMYFLLHGESLQGRIDNEMSGSDFDQAAGLAGNDGTPAAAAARQQHARGVIADSDGWFSNDPNRALAAIRALPPGEAAAVESDPDTREHLTTVLGGSRWVDSRGAVADQRGEQELQILLTINQLSLRPGEQPPGRIRELQAEADAVELDRYVRRGTGGDAPDIDQLFARIRASVLADPSTSAWSAAEVDDEVRRRTRAMENAYERRFGAELPTGGVSALRTAMARNLWGTNREIAVDLLDVNRAGERAARLQRTTEGVYTSDSEMNAELERTYNDALAEVRRNDTLRAEVEERAHQLMVQDGILAGGRTPTRQEVEAYRQEATEDRARLLAQDWMAEVTTTFGARYAWRWGGNAADALRYMVEDTTQWGGEDEALARLEGGGGLTAAQHVRYGVAGWGIERDMIMKGIGGRTQQQIERIGEDYASITHGENMIARLQSETGDWDMQTADTSLERDAFDIREALYGIPVTPEQMHQAATRRFEYERDVYFRDNPYEREQAVGPELAILQRAYDRATGQYAAYQSAVASGDELAIRRAEAGVQQAQESVNLAGDYYRQAVDAYVDRSAQIAAIVGAVVVGIVASAFLGPVGVALAASIAGTVMSMATKQAILGAAYSRHAFTNDLIVGVVDAIVTVLTARLGNILLRLPKPTGATRALMQLSMKAIEAQRLAKPVLQRVVAFTVEQVAQSVPSAVTGALLDRGTWRGDPLRNVATSAGMAAMIGVGVGTAIHGVTTYGPKIFGVAVDAIKALRSGSGAEIAADRVLLRSTAESLHAGDLPRDALAQRGTPLERLAARREYLRRFPEKTVADFDRALADGTADAVAGAEAVREARREMMRHFLEGIPPAERGKFTGTPIVVLSDADFVARTGSESRGRAATLIVDGEPVVVVREGAPPSVLREEGMHARQIRDALNAERVARLDERSLAEWASTSLEDRVAAWHAKLDLELEVQSRLVTDLDAELSRPGLSAERAAALADRLNDAESALEVLTDRRAILNDLDPGAFDRMRAGTLDPPHFLAEEPRLFNKQSVTPEEAGVRLEGTQRVFPEPEFKEGGRRTRWVKEYDDYGNLVAHYLERYGKKGWRKSGQVGRWGGGVAEVAMRMENAQRVGVDAKGVKRVQLDAQTARGWGFDDVMPEFRRNADGSVHAEIVVGEGKDYAGTVTCFSAIDTNFKNNLQRVRDRLDHLLRTKTWAAAGMDQAEVRAAIKAVDERRVRVEVRVSDSTQIVSGTLEDIQRRLRRKFGKNVSVSRGANISLESIEGAERWWDTIERYRLGGTTGMVEADSQLFRELAQRPTGISPRSIEIAETVVMARREHAGRIDGVVRWEPQGRYLVDGKGRPFEVHTAGRGQAGFDPEAEASMILGLADRSVVPEGAASARDMRVIVDFGELSSPQVDQVLDALLRQAKARSNGSLVGRLVPMHVPGDVNAIKLGKLR